jgi:multidrug transporter EmrE-like cation transporter
VNQFWLAMAAIVCNVGAQVAVKLAGQKIEAQPGLLVWISPEILLAVFLYGLAFLFTIKVFAVNPITVAGPIMAGATFVLVGLAGSIIFAEALSLQRLLGMACILLGILLVTRSI